MTDPAYRASRRDREQNTEPGSSLLTLPARPDETDVPRCRRCRRPLHTELAVAAGLGPVCAMSAIARVPYRPGGHEVAADWQLELPLDRAVSADG